MAKITVEKLGKELLQRRAARDGFIPFITYTKPDYEVAQHHELIGRYLESVERGEIKRLIINTPPRHGKSEMVTRRFPAWFIGRNPNRFVISASYNADFATDFGRDVRRIVASPEYANVFPSVGLMPDSRAADRWNTTAGGAYFAAGVGSGITGRGMHLGVVDDPIKDQEEANSPAHLEKVWRWYKTAFKTRMMPDAAIILAMTRWAKGDLVGRVLEDEPDKWTVVNLPAFAMEDDLLGRAIGDPLWPAWYSMEHLTEMHDTLEPREWTALYQGKPIADGGNLFQEEWWKFYKELPTYEAIIQYWDTAFETNERNSYSVCTTMAICEDGFYVVHVHRERMDWSSLRSSVDQLAEKFRPTAILIEKRASGISLAQDLQRNSRYTVEPISVVKDKVSRAAGITSICRAGRVFLPEYAPWLKVWRAELEEFPSARYDDQVDSFVGALTYARDNYTFRAAGNKPQEVQMSWDVYRDRQESQFERDWDIFNRRVW